MNFTGFQNALSEEIRRQSEGRIKAVSRSATKNNGIVRETMELCAPGETMTPSVYLDSFYEQYLRGVSVSHLAKLMLAQYCEFRDGARLSPDFFRTFENVEDHVFCKLINFRKNRELLREIPYEPWLDLAAVCYYQIDSGPLEDAVVLIRNSHLKRWGTGAGTLFAKAWENSRLRKRSVLQKLSQVLLQWGGLDEEEEGLEDHPLYLLTNERKCLGAACISYPGEAERIAEQLQSDYYMLPSSVHECLILPDDGRYSADELGNMVQEINRTQLQPQEILADHVYRYDRKTQKMSCAG
jgi:hypothetical protein